MANIFTQTRGYNEKVKRNNFDLSFQNHLTMKFGTLYPVFCKEVVPGDSFKIDTAFGLKFMPMVFPVQSGMRAHMHFFYCRNKNLWKNWENWIMNLEEHTHPYISQDADFFKSGSLADYLDVPTTVISSASHGVNLDIPVNSNITFVNNSGNVEVLHAPWIHLCGNYGFPISEGMTWVMCKQRFLNTVERNQFNYYMMPINTPLPAPISEGGSIYMNITNGGLFSLGLMAFAGVGDLNNASVIAVDNDGEPTQLEELPNSSFAYSYTPQSAFVTAVNEHIALGESVYLCFYMTSDVSVFTYNVNFLPNYPLHNKSYVFTSFSYDGDVTLPVDSSAMGSTPFDKHADAIRLNALPFRAYESIYQAFYRNTQNQDFIIDGHPVYNRYNTTTEDGADSTPYHLFQRNYEMDYLTSAFPSPQQGNAPIIGMSALGNITIEDESGITTAHAEVGEDGDTITGVVITSPVASQGHYVTLAELASAGFTISSFREGNALTRWLETNMRKGYRYVDFIEGHHDVRPEYRVLDMPEFIGGFSRDVSINSILNQTASPDAEPLGSFAGTANCFGGSNHSISHFCDDYGWIIGILCVVPTPAYSQLLPKHYLKQSQLDYYFHEFSQLGMQPITYEEVCPTQAYLESLLDPVKKLQDTFGYQRPSYDLVAFTDQVHGNFRTDMRNFLINRVFGNRPELGHDFLIIKPEEVNDIFAVTTPDNDVIAGQIVFRVHAKRPIPRVSIPSLGR